MGQAPLSKRHAPSIEPAVDDLRDTLHSRAAGGARECYLVDPGLMNHQVVIELWVRKLCGIPSLEGLGIQCFDLGNACGGVLMLGVGDAYPDIERRAPVPLAR